MRRIVADHTMFAPRGCMVCGASSGELLDTEVDFGPHGLRPYLCPIHVKEVARVWGYAEGDELDDLLRVRKTLTATEQQLAEAVTDIRTMLAAHEEEQKLYAERTAEYEHERQRADQLQSRLEQTIESIQATTDATRELVEPAKPQQLAAVGLPLDAEMGAINEPALD